jgi:tetratricopeptide (TPR) repeat protein
VRYAAAAAIAITIGVLGVMNYSSTSSPVGVEPLSALDLGTVRGVDDVEDISAIDEATRQAIQLANDGQIKDAVRILVEQQAMVEDPKVVAELTLTLGSVFYNAGEFELAVNAFRSTRTHQSGDLLIDEKALWYEGNALLQLGLTSEAVSSFRDAYQLNGAYSRILKSYLDALEDNK